MFLFSVPAVPEALPKRVRRVSERIESLQQDPKRAALLAAVRAELAETFGEQLTIRGLRMKKGLSQTMLAELTGTKQPHIARIEAGQDIYMSTARKLAAALDLDISGLDRALQHQEQLRNAARSEHEQA